MRVTLESDPVPFYIHFTLLILHTSSHACLLRSQPNIALIKNGLNYMNYQCKILGFYIWSFLSVIVQDSLAFILHSFCSILKSFDFNLDVFTKIKILSKGLRKFERWKDVGLKNCWVKSRGINLSLGSGSENWNVILFNFLLDFQHLNMSSV